MASAHICDGSTSGLITKLVTSLLEHEQEPLHSAAVRKRRAQIYEAILRHSTDTSIRAQAPCMQTELLAQQNACYKELHGRNESLCRCQEIVESTAEVFKTSLGNDIAYLLLSGSKLPQHVRNAAEDKNIPPIRTLFKLKRLPETINFDPHRKKQFFKHIKCIRYTINLSQSTKTQTERKHIKVLGSICSKNDIQSGAFHHSRARIKEPRQSVPSEPIRLPLLPQNVKGKVAKLRAVESDLPAKGKNYVTDLMVTHDLKHLIEHAAGHSFQTKIVTLPHLIEDLRLAAAGVETVTFVRDANGYLQMHPNVTLRTVLPEVLTDFVQPFLRSGDCCYRLRKYVKWLQDDKLPARIERPLNRTMRLVINDFLDTSRQILLTEPTTLLTKLYESVKPVMQLLGQVDNMFNRESRLNLAEGTCGSYLLSCIWREMNTSISSKYFTLLLYFLKHLCQTYYKQLQQWLYHGVLDTQMNDLFICCSQKKYNEHSKEFFDKAYELQVDQVPGFVLNCEQAILQCGKYNRLLREFKTEHAIFEVQYPDLVVCLNESQLATMHRNLEEHYRDIWLNFKPCSIQKIYEQRALAKRRCHIDMQERTHAHIANWEQQQRQLLLQSNAQKQQMYKQLNAQREQQQQEQIEQRRLDIVRELEFQHECEQLAEQRQQREKQALQAYLGASKENEKEPEQNSSSSRSYVSCEEMPSDIEDHSSSTLLPMSVQLQRSHSDVLNSNVQEASEGTELERNRAHMLSSVQIQDSQTRAQTLQHTSRQLERNRLRVLNCTEEQSESVDVNLNALPGSEFERNRQRSLQHVELNTLPTDMHEERVKRQVQSNTQLARNRQHVLASEYNIIVPDRKDNAQQPAEPAMELSVLARNRQRVLASEYNIIVPDRQDNEQQPKLARNRQRLLSTELNIILPDKQGNVQHPAESAMELSELARNQQRILASECNIIMPLQQAASPMSTTSDLELSYTMPDATNNNTEESHISNEAAPQPNGELPEIGQLPIDKSDPADKTTRQRLFKLFGSTPPAADTPLVQGVAHNPYMIKRCLQLSLMLPLNAHMTLLRNELLRIFLEDLNLYEHFRQLRNHFFLVNGQFSTLLVSGILDPIEAGMQPNSLCQRGMLDGILNNALGASSAAAIGNLTLNCSHVPKSFDLKSPEALSCFTLQYKVDWPLNMVISDETLAKYQKIFSHLLKLRLVNFVLECAYVQLQQLAKMHGTRMRQSPQYRHLQVIRHQLSHFVTTLQTHLTLNALEGAWVTFKKQLLQADCIEHLYQQHVTYLKHIVFLSLLNRHSAKLLETIDRILMIILRFCKVLRSQDFVLDMEQQQFVHPRYKRLMYEECQFDKFMRYIIYLGNKVAASGYQDEIGDLIRVINFNNHYKLSDDKIA